MNEFDEYAEFRTIQNQIVQKVEQLLTKIPSLSNE